MASHPSPFHRQRQSNKTLDPTGQTAKFLYTILKQLDLKNIDWNEVATGLDITNGHAARMRWSRFRAQIEGLDNSYSRKGGRKKDGERKRKKNSQDGRDMQANDWNDETTCTKRPKLELGSDVKMEDGSVIGTNNDPFPYGRMKAEPMERISVIDGVNVHHPTATTISIPETSTASNSQTNRYGSAPQSLSTSQSNQSRPATVQQPVFSPYGFSGPQASMQRSHRGFSTGYAYPYHHPTAPTSTYCSAPGVYNKQHGYPNFYPNQFQQRYNYGQQQFYNKSNAVAALMPRNFTSSVSAQSFPTQQLHPQMQPIVSTALSSTTPDLTKDSTSNFDTSQLSTALQAHAEEQALEMAAQASYPWPYSETSLMQFVQEASDSHGNGLDSVNSKDSVIDSQMQQAHPTIAMPVPEFALPTNIENISEANDDAVKQQGINNIEKSKECVLQDGEAKEAGDTNLVIATMDACLVEQGKEPTDAAPTIKLEADF